MMTPEEEAEGTGSPTGTTTRRRVIGALGTAVSAGLAATAAAAPAQGAAVSLVPTSLPPPALVPRGDLVSVLHYEDQARLVLGPAKVAPILGSDRTVTDRITLHPRMNIYTRDLDLTSNLFGDDHFAPIIVGPMADQRRFHPDGELATARGASAAQAAMVVSGEAGLPLTTIAEAVTTPLWLQVHAGSPRLRDVLAQAGATKARVVMVTVNAGASATGPATPASSRINWAAVEAVVRATSLPVIVKGVTRPQDAREAVARGAKGVVVSNYRGGDATALPGTLLLIAPVVEAVDGQVPVLADGGFRRGTDILKALAFGAKGVLIGRPAMWGLGAYGAEGVQGVVEMLQTELARYMAMCGCPTLASIHPGLVRVHAPLPTQGDHRG